MANQCLLAFDNLLEQGTVTVSNNTLGNPNEDADNPIENLYDWRTTDFYKPNELGEVHIDLEMAMPAQADYLALFAHDLHTTGCTIRLQYHDGLTYQNASPLITPADGKPLVLRFTSRVATKWRVVVTAPTDIPSIGVLSFGASLFTERGVYLNYAEPIFARAPELVNSVSEGGSFLGRSIISQGFKTNLVLQYASDAWVRNYWLLFVKHAEQKPFFYLWNIKDFPGEAAFCWTVGAIPAVTHTHYKYSGTTVAIEGKVE